MTTQKEPFWKWSKDLQVPDDDYRSESELKLADIKPNPPVKPSFYAVPIWMQGYWKCDFKTSITPVMCIGGGWMSVGLEHTREQQRQLDDEIDAHIEGIGCYDDPRRDYHENQTQTRIRPISRKSREGRASESQQCFDLL